jgi:glycosyltransferase involved in cell wall biosynthesis
VFSVIVPAHNEGALIGRTLRTMLAGDPLHGELEIIVVCNGCSDDTAAVARSFGAPVRVIETARASKCAALNLGDAASVGWPRLYVDADVLIDLASLRALASALDEGWLAAAPRPHLVFPDDTSWLVRAYFDAWMALPYVQEGMVTAGVYGLSRAGRSRFQDFPDILADDHFVRSHFTPEERIEVPESVSRVQAPASLADLMRVRTRARLGTSQIEGRLAGASSQGTKSDRYLGALAALLRRPRLYPATLVYLVVALICARRARRRLGSLATYTWERDEGARVACVGDA